MVLNLKRVSEEEFRNLKCNDVVFVKIGKQMLQSRVTHPAFYNCDADDPDWEVVTNNGFCDMYSIYLPTTEKQKKRFWRKGA